MTSETHNKHFMHRDGNKPFTFELARTEVPQNTWNETPYWLLTLVDLHLGVVINAMTINPSQPYPPEYGPCWDWLDFKGEDEDPELLTIRIPDESVLSDAVLASLSWDDGISIVRRGPGEPLHPVHEAAIEVLLRTPDWVRDVDDDNLRFERTLEELKQYSLYEHKFDNEVPIGYRPDATYKQPRDGGTDDEHASHDFDPFCCGIARLQALQSTPHLTPAHRRGQTGRTDASNGA